MRKLVQAIREVQPSPKLLFVTTGTQAVESYSACTDRAGIAHGGTWGIARVLHLEAPTQVARSIDMCASLDAHSNAARLALQLSATRLSSTDEPELVWTRKSGVYTRRLHALGISVHSAVVEKMGVQSNDGVITDGLGGLGLRSAHLLIERGSVLRLVLASRSGCVARDGQGLSASLTALRESSSAVVLLAIDIGEPGGTSPLLHTASRCGTVLHAAGALHDSLLRSMSASRMTSTFGSKASGASQLCHGLSARSLSSFVAFSSVAAAFGNIGQANYAAANTCLDALATTRRARGATATSVQWGAWAEVGMASRGAAGVRLLPSLALADPA